MEGYASLSQYLAGINAVIDKDGCIYPGQSLQTRRRVRINNVYVHDDIVDAAVGVFGNSIPDDSIRDVLGHGRRNRLENAEKLANPKATGQVKIPLRPTMWLTARTRVVLKVKKRRGEESSSSSSSE